MTRNAATSPRVHKAETITTPKRYITLEERYRMIAEAAYYRAERRGFAGDDMAEDWHAAETEIGHMLRQEDIAVLDDAIANQVRANLENEPDAIADQVRDVTLQALSGGEMDKESVRQIAAAVVAGAKEATAGLEAGATALKEAMRGLDEALAAMAEATHLALQEAAGRSDEFSRQALRKTVDDLGALESLFIETLSEGAKNTAGFAQTTLTDLAEHARTGGSTVGCQVKPALKQLANAFTDTLQTQTEIGNDALHKEHALLTGIVNGIIKGIVEHLHAADANGPSRSAKGRR